MWCRTCSGPICPGAFDAYIVVAIPIAFLTSALVGVLLERSVIRWLYGGRSNAARHLGHQPWC